MSDFLRAFLAAWLVACVVTAWLAWRRWIPGAYLDDTGEMCHD